jgi:hypothetical protein
MAARDAKIKVIVHSDRPVKIDPPEPLLVEEVEPGEGTILRPPDALAKLPPGELLKLPFEVTGPGRRVFASRGGKADLKSRREEIAAALDAGEAVEVHVFDDPAKG